MHTTELGITNEAVQSAIIKHAPGIISKVKPGQPLNVITKIEGQRIQYSVFQLPDGTYNIGRIHEAF